MWKATTFHALVLAAKQVVGDDFAIKLIEVAREYPYQGEGKPWVEASFGLEDRAAFPELGTLHTKSRLPGQAMTWKASEGAIRLDVPGSES